MAAMKRGARRKETGLKLGYGWIPDLPDHRDILYGAVHRVAARLPASVDLRRGCSPVEDQGDLGSCTGNALAGAVEFLEKRSEEHTSELQSRLHLVCRLLLEKKKILNRIRQNSNISYRPPRRRQRTQASTGPYMALPVLPQETRSPRSSQSNEMTASSMPPSI